MPSHLTDRRWRLTRIALNLALALWFICIAFWLGPNKIKFGEFGGLSVTQFVPIAQKYCLPQVREMKLFQQQHARFPTAQDLSPVFDWNVQSRNCPQRGPGLPTVQPNNYSYMYFETMSIHENIEYDFTPGKEGWFVRGPFLTAPLPLPMVQLDAASRP